MMKMKFSKILVLLASASFLATGCDSLSKMVKKHPTDAEYVQTPNPMEMHGDKVKISVEGSYKPNYFNKKAGVVFQPELQYEGGSTPLKPIVLKGETVSDMEGTTIKKKEGGKFTYADEVPYKPEYKNAKLIVNPTVFPAKSAKSAGVPASNTDAAALKKALALGEKTMATGVNTTPNLADNQSAKPSFAKDNYKKAENPVQKATLYFVVDMSNLNMNLAANKTEEAKKAFEDLKSAMKGEQAMVSIKVIAWASPEGELARNNNLAKDRSKTAEKYVRDMYKKAIDELVKEYNKNLKKGQKRITAKQLTQELPLTVEARGEDWDSFMAALRASTIADKDRIINVIQSNDPARREQEMRNMIVTYKEIEDEILPPLRRAEMAIEIEAINKTNEEMLTLATASATDSLGPKDLTVEELLFAGTLTEDNAVKMKIYTAATEVYPNDWRGFNNVAFLHLQSQKYEDADAVLQKANELSANNATVLNNMGVVALSKDDFENAKKYFSDAKNKGNAEAGPNLAPILIKEGDYAGASAALASQKGDLNLALSQILSGDLAGAKQTLSAAKESPKANYLKAIVAAREDNANEVYANLKKCDSEFKRQAQEDVEFRKFANEIEFTNATK